MNKKRWYSMDWIRILAFAFIIFYHMLQRLEVDNRYVFSGKTPVYYMNTNLHIALIGVSLFFMISGAGLMLSSERNWNLKEFYQHRFGKLLIPFYVVEVFAFIAFSALSPDWIAYFPEVSKLKIVFNLLGMDGYFQQYMTTFCLYAGEWFLGALIMLYVVFPVFRFCMSKNRYLTILVATLYYLLINYFNVIQHTTPWTNVFVKAYDFILGMFLILELPKLLEKRTFKIVVGITSIAIIIFGIVCPQQLTTPMVINNLIYAVAIFVLFFVCEDVISQFDVCNNIVKTICGISYEVFLVHHIVIYYIEDRVADNMGRIQLIQVFVTELLIMIALALLVQKIVEFINSVLASVFSNKN